MVLGAAGSTLKVKKSHAISRTHDSLLICLAKSPKTLATALVPPPAIVPSKTAIKEPGYLAREASTAAKSTYK